MRCLSIEDQETIALACVQELTADEAAAILQISASAFRTRLSRARKRLKTLWNSKNEND